jgi:hypothetical protein
MVAVKPFDLAWSVLKAPIYTDENPPPTEQDRHYEMLPHLGHMGGFMWQSYDGMARGTMRPDFDNNSLIINNFEMGGPMRAQGHARNYLQQMIDEGHEEFMHELEGTHVTNVEPHAARFWNKMVDEGFLDGAHERGHIRQSPDGSKHFLYAYNPYDMGHWQHEVGVY